jgi:hypothetical protein
MRFERNKIVVPAPKLRPTGYYTYRVDSLEEGTNRSGVKMFTAALTCISPGFQTRKPTPVYMTVGKTAWELRGDEDAERAEYVLLHDPEGEQAVTQENSRGLAKLMSMAQEMGWERANADVIDTNDLIYDIEEREYLVGGFTTVDEDKTGPYTGIKRNEIKFFYKVGAHKEGPIEESSQSAPEGNTAASAPAAERQPRRRTRAAIEEDGD